MNALITRIEDTRKRKGVMKKHIAERCGHTPDWYSKLLRGERILSAEALQKIADALGEKPGSFFEHEIGESEISEHNTG